MLEFECEYEPDSRQAIADAELSFSDNGRKHHVGIIVGTGIGGVVTLLDKPARREVAIAASYRGFEIGDEFVVGYGLDYAEEYRHLPAIYDLQI